MAGEIISRAMTAEELFWLPDDGWCYELIRGDLYRMSPAKSVHGVVAMRIGSRLDQFVTSNHLGIVLAAETGFILERNPDTVRAPDAAFVKKEHIPPGGIPKTYWPNAPDLAVEVVSPGDLAREVEDKAGAWLRAGASEVWVIDPASRTVAIHGRTDNIQILEETDAIEGGPLLPGFQCGVRTLFEGI